MFLSILIAPNKSADVVVLKHTGIVIDTVGLYLAGIATENVPMLPPVIAIVISGASQVNIIILPILTNLILVLGIKKIVPTYVNNVPTLIPAMLTFSSPVLNANELLKITPPESIVTVLDTLLMLETIFIRI